MLSRVCVSVCGPQTHTTGEETNHGRIVRVTIPTSGTAVAVPDAALTEFVLETRLRAAGERSRGADTRGGTVSQVCSPVRVLLFVCLRGVCGDERVVVPPREKTMADFIGRMIRSLALPYSTEVVA